MAANFHGRITPRLAQEYFAGSIAACTMAISLAHAESPDQILAKRGLKASGWVYVVDAESSFSTQLAEAKDKFKKWGESQGRLEDQQENLATIDELTEQSMAMKNEISAWKQQNINPNLNPQFGGFGQSPFVPQGGLGAGAGFGQNAFARQFQNNQNAQLAAQLEQAEQSLSQMNNEINRLKKLGLTQEEARKIQDESEQQRETLRTLTEELRKSADGIVEQYKGLKSDPAIGQALAAIGSAGNAKPKLGPSRTFHADLKTLERMERTLASGRTRVAKSSKSLRKHKSKSSASAKKSTPKKGVTP